MADPVFVQPHFDDVALSCGGTVSTMAETESPLIVTVFAGEPSGAMTDFAKMQHEQWNLTGSEVVQARRREDADAAVALGSSVRVRWFDYPDAIYRQPDYDSEEALFGNVATVDYPLVAEIAERLKELGDSFFLPLAVGRHVDHQIVFAAGLALEEGGAEVWFYADMPYALDSMAFQARIDELDLAEVIIVTLAQERLDRKWAAIESYRSQLPVLFRGMDDPRSVFEGFGRDQEDGTVVERFWRVTTTNGTNR